MRIAIVSDAIYPYNKGGKETRIFELSTRLAAAGHEVDIYTMKWWDQPGKIRIEQGVTLHAISRKYPLYHGERRSMAEGMLFGLASFKLLNKSFDVVDVDHMPYFPLFSMWLVCALKRKPMVATWHEVWGGGYWREYLGRLGFAAAMLEKLTVKLPDRIIAVSPFTAERLTSVLHTSVPVAEVMNGVNTQAIATLKPAKTKSDMVYAGRLLAHKGVDQLIRAVAQLAGDRPDIRALVIGDGPERAHLEQLARDLGVTRNVTFTGFIESDDDKLRLMKASNVFVLPSTREGFGIAVLEAMACGLAVVTVDHPDNAARHLVTPDVGVLCAPDATAIAGAIDNLLTDSARRRTEAAALAYDWGQSAQALTKVYAP